MRIHELKCWPRGFAAVGMGVKRADVRPDDRAFKERDLIHLREYEPQTREYTGNDVVCWITHIQRLDEEPFEGFPEGWVMLSIKLLQ